LKLVEFFRGGWASIFADRALATLAGAVIGDGIDRLFGVMALPVLRPGEKLGWV